VILRKGNAEILLGIASIYRCEGLQEVSGCIIGEDEISFKYNAVFYWHNRVRLEVKVKGLDDAFRRTV